MFRFIPYYLSRVALTDQTAIKDQAAVLRMRVFLISSLIASFIIHPPYVHVALAQDSPDSQNAKYQVYLPTIVKIETPSYALLPQESAIQSLFLTAEGQKHTTLKLNPLLSAQARKKAQDMANRGYFGHVDPDGRGPNVWVRDAGYVLPSYYSTARDGNNIESIGAGYAAAEQAWSAWMGSSGHRMHLLGDHEFYQEQIEYGIGYAYKANSPYGHYWVVLIAKPG